GMETDIYFSKIRYPIIMVMICISLSLYMYYTIKKKDIKLLLINIIYMIGVTYVYPPSILILASMITEYVVIKKYNETYAIGIIFICVFATIKLGINYTNIFLGLLGSIFIYNIVNYEEKLFKLEKSNYDLKEKNYDLEERRKLENKNNYQSMEAIKIEERNIISQKLHDKIGHTLAGSIMQLEALKIIINADKDKGISMLDSIIDNLRNGMDDIRYTLKMIKPAQSEMSINNLKHMLDEFSEKSNIKTNLNIEGDLNEINLVYWKALIDCGREILTNTIKYSNGDVLNVHISVLNKIIRLHIKDNGIYKNKMKKGMGLLGIEERIVNLGGDVYFNNEDGFSNLIILKR
ncbi:MAG: histidine kinase, partial [Bacilli bacterium]